MMSTTPKTVNVLQGEFAISDRPDEIITTVLGSCISVCLTDSVRGMSGMNHFLLPKGGDKTSTSMRYGANAMELLINGMLKKGAERDRLEAKIFGGADIIGNGRGIGASNALFARGFLEDEGIQVAAESVGGFKARRIRLWPTTGVVRQMLIDEVPVDDPAPPVAKPVAPDVVLF